MWESDCASCWVKEEESPFNSLRAYTPHSQSPGKVRTSSPSRDAKARKKWWWAPVVCSIIFPFFSLPVSFLFLLLTPFISMYFFGSHAGVTRLGWLNNMPSNREREGVGSGSKHSPLNRTCMLRAVVSPCIPYGGPHGEALLCTSIKSSLDIQVTRQVNAILVCPRRPDCSPACNPSENTVVPGGKLRLLFYA